MCGRKHWFLSVTRGTLRWFALGKVRTKCRFKANPQPPLLMIFLRLVVSERCAQQQALMWCISLLHPAGGDNSVFNSPAQSTDMGKPEEEEGPSQLPPYSRLTWRTSAVETGYTHPSFLHSRGKNHKDIFHKGKSLYFSFFLNYGSTFPFFLWLDRRLSWRRPIRRLYRDLSVRYTLLFLFYLLQSSTL